MRTGLDILETVFQNVLKIEELPLYPLFCPFLKCDEFLEIGLYIEEISDLLLAFFNNKCLNYKLYIINFKGTATLLKIC